MLASKDKISLRQAIIIMTVGMYIPTLRLIPINTAATAKQAAWVSPAVALIIYIPVILILNCIYKKYEEESFVEVAEDIFGKILGKMVTIIYIVQNTLILIVNTNRFADRMVAAIYPNVNILIFYIIMLSTVALILRKGGIVVLARMSEVLIIIVVFLFLLIFIMAIKNIKVSRLTPISPLDILPILKSSLAVMGILALFPNLFLLSNYINDKEKIKKYCIPAAFLQVFMIMLLLVVTIGSLGSSIVEISTYPYLSAVKTISLFEFLSRIDALAVSSWLFSDFVIISLMMLIVLNLFKSLLKLSDTRPLIGIYTIITFFLVHMLSRNSFELIPLAERIISPATIFLGFVLPFLLFVVGKIRKKI